MHNGVQHAINMQEGLQLQTPHVNIYIDKLGTWKQGA